MNAIQRAVCDIKEALKILESAKVDLRQARDPHYVQLGIQIAAIKEILVVLTDPECTPEVAEVVHDG